MTTLTTVPRDEVARRGKQIYEHRLRQLVEPGNVGRYLSIDVLTGEYEIGDDKWKNVNAHLENVHRLLDRVPGAIIYTVLIGYPAIGTMGGSMRPNGLDAKP